MQLSEKSIRLNLKKVFKSFNIYLLLHFIYMSTSASLFSLSFNKLHRTRSESHIFPPTTPWISLGLETHKVPLELFAENRRRLVDKLRSKVMPRSIVLLQGGNETPFYDTDITFNVFRQESYFMWAFGATEPGFYGAIEVDSGNSYLFVPQYPDSYAVWMGPIYPKEHFADKYCIYNVHYTDDIATVLSSLQPSVLLILNGINSDSNLPALAATFDGINKFKIDNNILYDEIADLRVYKTDYEIDVLKYVIKISSEAHRKVMRFVAPGKTEYQCESEFLHHCYSYGGCRHMSSTCICASSLNTAILHYGHAAAPNDRTLTSTDLCLFDMGANYFGYCADITCTFPVNGKFTPDQKLIYEAVLCANLAVQKYAKEGIKWTDMHLLANRVLLDELKKAGLLKGDVKRMVDDGLGSVFQPHGLGHFLGLDVHDVGGYLSGYPARSNVVGLDKLRTARVLEKRMCITIEPGCYFIDCLLDKALSDPVLSKYLVPKVIERFRGFGGVRIEDNVIITEKGIVNMTRVPRTVKEIEAWMAGKDDKKYD